MGSDLGACVVSGAADAAEVRLPAGQALPGRHVGRGRIAAVLQEPPHGLRSRARVGLRVCCGRGHRRARLAEVGVAQGMRQPACGLGSGRLNMLHWASWGAGLQSRHPLRILQVPSTGLNNCERRANRIAPLDKLSLITLMAPVTPERSSFSLSYKTRVAAMAAVHL